MGRLFITALLFFFFFFFPSFTIAADNFSIASDVDYTISEDNMAHTTLRIALTNTSSQYYASEYTIRIGFSNIDNIRVSDPQGTIIPVVTKANNGYTIKVPFNKPVVGIGNTLPFTIQFDTPDIVQQQGNIYEIAIPGIANQTDFSEFNVHVHVPSFYGAPTYIKPNVGGNTLDFTKEQLGTGGVSIGFGDGAMYYFTLKYHLGNKNVFPIRTEIALPPDTTYQKVSIDDISPKPSNVIVDGDGNWLAQYSLLPSEKKTVEVRGKVAVSLKPKEQMESKETLAKYLLPRKYWEASDEKIQTLAKELKTPKAIYEYVVKTLSYDFSRVTDRQERLGAALVLRNPKSAVCLEFTDLFIAIARAAGIPAREIDGFAYAKNPAERPLSLENDILHAWPEYYDETQKTWIMVDPTWGNTTEGVDYFDVFDFNHIAFVIKGTDSTYPIPAGGYKLRIDKTAKDVEVTPVQSKNFPKASALASIQIDRKVFAGIPFSGQVRIVNPRGPIYPSQHVEIKSEEVKVTTSSVQTNSIPPFGYIDVPITFQKTGLFDKKNATITVLLTGGSIYQSISIVPFYYAFFEKPLLPWTVGGGVFVAIVSIIIWVTTRKPRNLPVS